MTARRAARASLLATALLAAAPLPAAAAVDVGALWNFADPAASEQRFRAALAGASGDDALVLQTQIARTFSLRREVAQAQTLLRSLEPQLASAGAEARARHALEWGRTHISAVTRPEERTPEALTAARAAYQRAHAAAREGGLDGLAIDAVHMMAFVDDDPAGQVEWNGRALRLVEASTQPAGRAWEASIRHNLGLALHRQGRFDEALAQFERVLPLREQAGNVRGTRIARWMVAWTLRSLGRIDEALAIQSRLEAEWQAEGGADPYVFEELEHLHRAKGDTAQAAAYAERLAVLRRAAAPR